MKYLFYCGPGIGDLLILLPYAKAIRKADSNAYIATFVTAKKTRFLVQKSVFNLQQWIDDIDCYNIKEANHIIPFLLHMGFRRFDYALVQQYTDKGSTSVWPMMIAKWAAKKTCGLQTKGNKHIVYDIEIPRVLGRTVRQNWEALLKAIDIPTEYTDDSLFDNQALQSLCEQMTFERQKERRCIALAIGAAPVGGKINGQPISNPAKNWDVENWVALANKLAEHNIQVVFLGDKNDAQALEAAGFTEQGGIQNWAGKTNVAESAAIIHACDLLICCDTGMLHVADAVGTPLLALFGCTDPNEYCPAKPRNHIIWLKEPCAPCFGTDQVLVCQEKNCMKRITVDMVFDEIEKILIKHEN